MANEEAIYEIDHPHDLPTHVLADFTAFNVDPYTNFVATIMLRDFHLSIKGQRNINAALSNLPVFMAVDERLQFGWGTKSMMRSKWMHAQGYEHAAVMIALSSTFRECYAAEVLAVMTAMTARSRDTVPHVKQWREMIRASNGSFISCDFDVLVEDFVRLDPYCVGPGSNLRSRRCLVPPRAMAKALIALSKVTNKSEKRLTLMGGAVISWFAAMGEYFYDLKVTVKSCGGALLHGHEISDDTQLILYYHQEPDLEILDTPPARNETEKMDEDDYAYTSHVHYLPFGGRVEWQALLPKVFGRAYHRLDHEQAKALNTAIGAAARGLEGATVSFNEDDSRQFASSKANPMSYGIGLIKNITAWLPELQRGQGRMERQLKKSFEENAETYFETFESLKKSCNCHICSTEPTTDQPRNGYCLPVIVETIVSLGLAISRMIVITRLYPSRQGVQGLYNSQVQKRLEAKRLDPRSAEFFKVIYGNEWNASEARRLQNAVELFSGTRPTKQIPSSLVALTHEGVCAYMARLQKSDQSPVAPESEGLIKVSSGSIYGRFKIFNRVSTEPVISDDEEENWSWEEVHFDHWSTPLYCR